MKAAFIPEVNDELDTQNFEKFEEVINILLYVDTHKNNHISSVFSLTLSTFVYPKLLLYLCLVG